MANLISGSADTALVTAASKAALAGVPYDQSDIHKRMSKSHAKMAKATGDMWSKALGVVGDVGSKLVEQAKRNNNDGEWDVDPDFIEQVETNFPESSITGPTIGDVGQTEFKDLSNLELERSELSLTEKKEFGEGILSYKDVNGNDNAITVMSTEQKLDSLREQKSNVGKKNTINPTTGLEWTRKERRAEKRRIRTVMDNVRRSNVDFGAFEQEMTERLATGGINEKASGMYNMNGLLFAEAMLAKGKPVKQDDPNFAAYDGARAIKGYNDDGNMIFTYVNKYGEPFKDKDGNNITIGKGDLDTLFVPKNQPVRDEVDNLIPVSAIQRDGSRKYGTDIYKNQNKKVIDEQVTDKNTFLDIAFYNTSGTRGPLADALNAIEYDEERVAQTKETPMFGMLISAIEGIGGKDDLDVTGDDEFTDADYATQENLDKVIKKALSGDNIELGKTLLELYYNSEVDHIYTNAVNANTDEEGVEKGRLNNLIKKV